MTSKTSCWIECQVKLYPGTFRYDGESQYLWNLRARFLLRITRYELT